MDYADKKLEASPKSVYHFIWCVFLACLSIDLNCDACQHGTNLSSGSIQTTKTAGGVCRTTSCFQGLREAFQL